MGNELRLNFIGSIVLTIFSVAVLVGSTNIYLRSTEPLHSSPALMPGMLGVALLLCSLLLFRQSVHGDGIRARAVEAKERFVGLLRHTDTRTTPIGMVLMAVYTFVLVRFLHFWLASLIFMVAMLLFLRATRWYLALVISGATVGGVVLLFSYVFNVPLP